MKLRLYVFLFLAVLIFSCNREEEQIPLGEHPRPGFERSLWQNLNGEWNFRSDSLNVGLNEEWQNEAEFFDEEILVPFSWASPMSGVERPDINVGWYYRTFVLDEGKNWEQQNIYLVFSACDFNTTLWVNGQKAGEHSGGYIPFDFNISEFLKSGENQMVVRVEDEELDNRPSGKQYYGNAKGIWNTVYLEGRPDNYIKNIKFTPDIDKSQLVVEVFFKERSASAYTFHLAGKNNNIDFVTEIPANRNSGKFIVPITNMKLWDLDNPFLYEVSAIVSSESFTDEVSTYFGMRKISAVEVPGKDFQYVALNNKPVYMKLSLDQSYHPQGFYTFPSDEFMKEEIQRAKNLGLNGLRIHIKAEMPRKLYWADKLGLLIMEDVPNFWGEPDSTAKTNWEYIAGKEIERDYNHPSIFSWVLFNETWGLFSNDEDGKRSYTPETQEWVRSWYHKTKEYDPTRLVEDNSPCNWDHVITDINTWHRYSPARHWAGFLDRVVDSTFPGSSFNYIGKNEQTNVPMFNSECGAVWGYSGSTGDIDITWEYHIMMNEFRKRPEIAGFLFTEFHDVINEWNGYYRFDRSEKKFGLDELCPGMTMKDFHSDLYVVAGEDFFQTYKGGSAIEIPVGISAVTSDIPGELKLRYSVYGWDEIGEKYNITSGETDISAQPFKYTELQATKVNLPDKTGVVIFSTALEDSKGNILQRNFVPFKVEGNGSEYLTVTQSPEDFTEASWNIKHLSPQNGNKVWGMGSGYFGYEFELPKDLNGDEVESIEFRAELASRYPQSKYLEEGEAEKIGMTVVTEKGIDAGYGKNSYPQTDEKLHGAIVKINANDQLIATVELPDDPADHRGILSWMNQEPGWEWGSDDHSKPWLLDEAGSYGFLVKADLDETSKKSALETGKVTIRLFVDESTENRGGLSVYGENSGMYPMDLTLWIKKSQ
ncbi:glycoside hydrolase family 2 [Maribellus comscasis]|uniref:Glycoside hydrolase family 2 n=1 Tax=Maribellus comscasis TaxID=2681766 RepID=A0A6I6JUA9_9BACT|nr:sugar-binding domain-containing protein [Maribellus comscasis]QGY43742.1 glycoside hydrolase family 2 [Maribellus comscasis]